MKYLKILIITGTIFLTACSANITTSNADEIKEVHKQNLEAMFALNFDFLESKFSKEFKILGSKSDKTLDYVAEVKKDVDPNAPVFKKNIRELYDFKNVYVFDYDQMVKNGIAKRINFLKDGDYFAQINPNAGISKQYGIEELALLYRKIDNNWIAIGGTQ